MEKTSVKRKIFAFLAHSPPGGWEDWEIFRGVMDPTPKEPWRWKELCKSLGDMSGNGLLTHRQHKVYDRIATIFQLTAAGWREIRGGKSDEDENGFINCESESV